MGTIISREACPKCREAGHDRSGDNLCVYDNGSKHCHACGYDVQPGRRYEREELTGRMRANEVEQLPHAALELRGIRADIAQKYGVRVEYDQATGTDKGYMFPVYRGTDLAGWQYKPACEPGKRKTVGNPFFITAPGNKGDGTKSVDPFGGHIAAGGKMVVVCEGAEDALAAFQMLKDCGKPYRVVATMGDERWSKMLPFFDKYAKVVIAYDMDDAGQAQAKKFAEALRPGVAHIMHWDSGAGNDPNALLLNGAGSMFLQSLYDAEAYQSGGFIYGEGAWQVIENYREPEYIPYPPEFAMLNQKLRGMRRGEISLWTSGTGCGKSAFMRRLKQHIIQNTTWTAGDIELEETKEKTIRAMLQYQGKKSLRDMTDAEKRAAFEATYGTKRIITLDRRAKLAGGANLLTQMKHLKYAFGADIILLDHITLAADEMGDGKEGIAAQDKMMADLLELAESTNLHIALISHLRKSASGGKSFEEGAMPSLDDLKGSGSVKQICMDIIALGRDVQNPDEYLRNVTQLRVLKNREDGNVGDADRLFYNKDSYSFEPAREMYVDDVPGDPGDPQI